MQYANFVIRKKRLEKNWSQEGLCQGICTPSYLSKIEQGKAEPSGEVMALLLKRMGVCWQEPEPEKIQKVYEQMLTGDMEGFQKSVKMPWWGQYENSPYGLDWLLLSRFAEDKLEPAEEALEICMDRRQLALQRMLQKRWEEAIVLMPCGYVYAFGGMRHYHEGNAPQAIELLQTAFQLAAQEGSVWIMLLVQQIMGSCYANMQDYPSMEAHYQVAERLASALGAKDDLENMAYNRAATQMELGQYHKALKYFEQVENPGAMSLHKLAICYEKLNLPEKAMDAIERAMNAQHIRPEQAEEKMCLVVVLRLRHPDYLEREDYGKALCDCFETCKAHLPVGYSLFHLPWMLDWYEYHRQYKAAYELLQRFPQYRKKP